MYVVPGHEEAWNFGKHQDSPSGRCDLRARSIVAVYEHCEFPILTGTHNFLRRELKHTDGACRDMLVKLISFFSASDISTFHGIAEYSLHPVRQKMVTFNHQLGQDQERVTSEMKQQLKKKCQQHRQVSSSWKSKKYLQQKQDGREGGSDCRKSECS